MKHENYHLRNFNLVAVPVRQMTSNVKEVFACSLKPFVFVYINIK